MGSVQKQRFTAPTGLKPDTAAQLSLSRDSLETVRDRNVIPTGNYPLWTPLRVSCSNISLWHQRGLILFPSHKSLNTQFLENGVRYRKNSNGIYSISNYPMPPVVERHMQHILFTIPPLLDIEKWIRLIKSTFKPKLNFLVVVNWVHCQGWSSKQGLVWTHFIYETLRW